jgi:hypothetical protein
MSEFLALNAKKIASWHIATDSNPDKPVSELNLEDPAVVEDAYWRWLSSRKHNSVRENKQTTKLGILLPTLFLLFS